MAELAAAYRALGFLDAADACERSLDVFPGREPPREAGARRRFLEAESAALFEDLEQSVYAVDWESLKLAMGRYIDSKPEEFAGF